MYWGYAAQPFAIDSPSRRYPVSGAPLPGDKSTPLTGDAVVKRARELRAIDRLGDGRVPDARARSTRVLQRVRENATTGSAAISPSPNDAAPDVAILQLEETVLPIGATVSAFGTWSASRGAIVAAAVAAARLVRGVAEGGPEALDGKPGVPTSTTGYVVGAIRDDAARRRPVLDFARIILPTVGL